MKKKEKVLIVFILVALAIFVIASGKINFGGFDFPTQTIPFSNSQCQPIPNPDNPQASFTESVTTSNYRCQNADECIVWGKMKLETPNQAIQVVFRTNDLLYGSGSWIAVYNGGNLLSGFYRSGNPYGSGSAPFNACNSQPAFNGILTPNGYKVISYNSNFYVCVLTSSGSLSQARKYDLSATSGLVLSRNPVAGYENKETTSNSPDYSGYFNFCANPSSPYCIGNKNFVFASSPRTISTNENNDADGETRISGLGGGTNILFNPTYANGNPVTDKVIYSLKADCTCTGSNVCQPNSNLCQRCPSGYTHYANNVYCSTLDGQSVNSQRSNVCVSPSGNTCTTAFKTITSCTGTHTVTSSSGVQTSCRWWNQATTQCGANQLCYLGSTGNTLGEGVGTCRCANNQCGAGDYRIDPQDPTKYNKCESVSGCYAWGTQQLSCPVGLRFDLSSRACVCDTNAPNYCDPVLNPQQCSGSSVLSCNSVQITDPINNVPRTCYAYSSPTACPQGQSCQGGGCGCPATPECANGDVVCNADGTYSSCTTDTSNVCPHYGAHTPVPQGKVCQNNQLITSPLCPYTPCQSGQECNSQGQCVNVGCSSTPNDPRFACSTTRDRNNIKVESCVNNACVPTQDEYFVPTSQASNSVCRNNNVWTPARYNTPTNPTIYRLEESLVCTGETTCG